MHQREVVIVAAKRTAIGAMNGVFATKPAHILGQNLIKHLQEKTKIEPDLFSEVILGHVLTAGCGQNPARQAAIGAGIHYSVPAATINQVCGSGLRAVALGAQAIKSGESTILIVGGQENMTLAPHAAYIRAGVRMGDASFVDTMSKDGLVDAFNNYAMGITAENLVKKYNISREDQDEYAFNSHQKAVKAQEAGYFTNEILPIKVTQKKVDIDITKDEGIRPDLTCETLASLRPVFQKDGTVTAGNSSSINDGAAVLIIMSREEAEKRELKPLARIISYAHAGVPPEIMGIGPVFAVQKALKIANWTVDDLDLIEANEAFAAQAISVNRQLEWDLKKVNIHGGAIALGHPIGASGARVLVTLIHAMHRTQSKKGLVTLCIGGGMGIAMCIEAEI